MPIATQDPVVLNEWLACGWPDKIAIGQSYTTCLLGQTIEISRLGQTQFSAHTLDEAGHPERTLPIKLQFCNLFTTLGDPAACRPLPIIEAFDDPRRRIVSCGGIGAYANAYRVIENFLDMAHFSFIHPDILGTREHTDVAPYHTELRHDVDEIWVTNCQFFQPTASLAAAEAGGQLSHYTYRIMSPFSVMFYKGNTADDPNPDVICLFVQPVTQTQSIAYVPMALIDPGNDYTRLMAFQQHIFLQDRIILENQRPLLMPLNPRAEMPARADAASAAYRRWLKGKKVRYGIYEAQDGKA